MARIVYSSIIFIISIMLLSQCSLDSDKVATVGNSDITVDDFKEMLKNRYPNVEDLNSIELKKKKEVLTQAIQKKLKVLAALDMNLEDDPEILAGIKKQEENLLGQKFFEVVIVDKLITEDEIKEYIRKQGYELEATFVLIGHKESSLTRKRTKEEAKKIAQEIIDKVAQGTDLGELAVQYSDDPSAKKKKGKTGIFRWGQKPDDFMNACWNMKVGDISPIIDSDAGFYIIRLDTKKKDPAYVEKYDYDTKFRTKKMLYSAVADSGSKLWAKKVEDLKAEKSYKLNDSELNKLAQLLNEKVKNAKVDISIFSDEEKNIVLAEWDDGKIEFGKILSRYESNLPRVLGALRDPKNLKREVQNLSLMSIVLSESKKMGLDEDEQISKTIHNFKEDRLAYLVEQRKVNDQISFTDEDVQKFYDQNPDQFMNPAKLEMWAITVKDKATANKIENYAKKGRNFEALAKKYSTDKYYKDKGGYLGFRTINSRGSISRKAFELEPNGQISSPVKYKNEWAIVKTGELRQKKLRPFHEVAKMVEGRLRNDLLKGRRNAWKKELKEEYPVKINEDVLNSI